MNHHAAETAMFWVGALFVFTPIVFVGVILGVWWYGKRRERREQSPADGAVLEHR